jgi:hypothetical protein
MLPLAAFLHMMPPKQLALRMELTNERLAVKGKPLLTHTGVCMLIASINLCGYRQKLWEGVGSTSTCLASYNISATNMSRNRWEDI